jgi:hypothetical protein
MKHLTILLALAVSAHAAPPDSFWRALHLVETSGRHGPIVGDGGKALGPLQIHRGYHADSRVPVTTRGSRVSPTRSASRRPIFSGTLPRLGPRAISSPSPESTTAGREARRSQRRSATGARSRRLPRRNNSATQKHDHRHTVRRATARTPRDPSCSSIAHGKQADRACSDHRNPHAGLAPSADHVIERAGEVPCTSAKTRARRSAS